MQKPPAEKFFDWLSTKAKKDSVEFDFYGNKTERTSISFQKEKLKNCSQSSSAHLNLRLLQGKKAGTSHTKNFSKEGIEECYVQALNSLQLSDKKERGWFGQDLEPFDEDFSVFYSEKLAKTPLQQKISYAEAINQACLKRDKKVQPVYSGLEDTDRYVFHGSSSSSKTGPVFFRSNGVHAACYGLAVDGKSRSNGVSEISGRDYLGMDFQGVGRKAGEKALKKLNWSLPETKKTPVLFQAGQASATLLSWLSEALSAKLLFDKLSLFKKEDLGACVFSKNFSLYEDPLADWGFASSPFDGEGFASEKTPLIEKGHLSHFLSSSFFAKALNIPHNKKACWNNSGHLYPAPSNLIMSDGESSFEELKKEFPRGTILLEYLKGLAGYNPTSGDFSIESEGFLLQDGEERPLCGFTVSGNIKQLFSNILKIGRNSQIYQGRVKAPSFLVGELMIAGK